MTHTTHAHDALYTEHQALYDAILRDIDLDIDAANLAKDFARVETLMEWEVDIEIAAQKSLRSLLCELDDMHAERADAVCVGYPGGMW